MTQVAMGKAHTCVLMKNGEVWTFGVNNKGQCGRDTGSMSQGGKGERPTFFFLLFCVLENITSESIAKHFIIKYNYNAKTCVHKTRFKETTKYGYFHFIFFKMNKTLIYEYSSELPQ